MMNELVVCARAILMENVIQECSSVQCVKYHVMQFVVVNVKGVYVVHTAARACYAQMNVKTIPPTTSMLRVIWH